MDKERISLPFELVDMEPVTIAGITRRVDNTAEGFEKIQQHWGEFFKQGVLAQIDAKRDQAIHEVYFDYESDASGPYTVLLGSRVDPGVTLAPGLVSTTLPASRYARFQVANPQLIFSAWQDIWARGDLARTYRGDFEVIREDGVDIYVAVSQ